jgi:hypothetical protein
MRRIFTQALVLVCAMGVISTASAIIITFDDLPADHSGIPVPNGYEGFDWTNFLALTGTGYPLPDTGYTNGIVSSPNVAVNANGDDATLTPAAPTTTFTLESGYFTSAYYNVPPGLPVTVEGFLPGHILPSDTMSFLVLTGSATLESFDWTGLSEVVFSSLPPGLTSAGSQTQFVLDNLDVEPSPSVPEPAHAAVAIFFAALGAVALVRRLRAASRLARLTGIPAAP